MIRPATPDDIDRLLAIYATARERMARAGNPSQWGTNRPARETLERDIRKGQLYAMLGEDGEVHAAFALVIGDDPTYAHIDGAWLGDEPYGTIHRIASDGCVRGVFDRCLAFCLERIGELRIDTHEDNAAMRHLIERSGFVRCGIITIDDGSPRIAYQRVRRG